MAVVLGPSVREELSLIREQGSVVLVGLTAIDVQTRIHVLHVAHHSSLMA